MTAYVSLDKLPPNRPATLVEVRQGAVDEVSAPGSTVESLRDISRRLVELGFVAGERVRVLRRGFPFGDPIAVRIGTLTIALRGFEAALVVVQPDR